MTTLNTHQNNISKPPYSEKDTPPTDGLTCKKKSITPIPYSSIEKFVLRVFGPLQRNERFIELEGICALNSQSFTCFANICEKFDHTKNQHFKAQDNIPIWIKTTQKGTQVIAEKSSSKETVVECFIPNDHNLPPTITDRSFFPRNFMKNLSERIFLKQSDLNDTAQKLHYLFQLCFYANSAKDHFIHFSVNNQTFTRPGLNKRNLSFPYSFNIEIKTDRMALTFFFKTRVFLGKGNFKIVEGGVKVSILRDASTPIMSNCAVSHVKSDNLTCVTRGFKIHEEILQIPGANKYFVTLNHLQGTYVGELSLEKSTNSLIEQNDPKTLTTDFVTDYYNTDVLKAIKNQSMPKELGSVEIIPLQTRDFITFCQNATKALKLLEKKNIFHQDFKPNNILVKERNGKPRAYLSDFDFTSKRSFTTNLSEDYVYWNYARQIGYASHETDRFGLILSIAQILLLPGSNYGEAEKFYKNISNSSTSWNNYKGSLTRDSFNQIFDLVKKTIDANKSQRDFIQKKFTEITNDPKLLDDLSNKYSNQNLSEKELILDGLQAAIYKKQLGKEALEQYKQGILPTSTIDQYKNKKLSPEELELYTKSLEAFATEALATYLIPSLSEIKSLLDGLKTT